MTDEQLIQRIKDSALLRGDFTLRSGRKSKYYLDKYLFQTRPDILAALAERFAEKIAAIGGGETSGDGSGGDSGVGGVDRLAGAELGGVPLVSAAGIATGLPFILIRNQKKNYGTAKQVEGELKPGDRVVILEDIATTGGQVLEAAQTLTDMGAKVVKIIAVIDRQEGARENIEAAGYGFDSLLTKADLGIGG
jgi:orotate phosphoribosyltransferase